MDKYSFHTSLYDLALQGTIFVGLTFVLLLWFTKRLNRAANRFLALALITIVLRMVWLLGTDIGLNAYFPQWGRLPLNFSLALGPFFYFYVLKITRPEYKLRWRDMLHFSPLLLEQFVFVLEVEESVRTGAATYNTYIFHQTGPVLQLAAFISVVIYLYLSFKLIERFYRRLKFNEVSDRYLHQLRWLRRMLIGFGMLWFLWIPYAAVDYFGYHHQLSIHAYYPLYLLLAIIMTRIAAVAFLRPPTETPVQAVPISKPLAPAALKQKGVWLKEAMKANRYYQDEELSLRSLAATLEMTPNELSRIINQALRKSFNDFINEYRVADVVEKMQDPAYDRLTLIGIAQEAGFNSKSTFNRIFREMTGKSPAEYKSTLQKERPTYTLRPFSRANAIISSHETTPGWSSDKLNRNYMFRNYLKMAWRNTLHNKVYSALNNYMFRNYLKMAWRNTLHNKVYSALNIAGLAAGMAVALLIGLWVADQYSFDRFLPGYQQLYQVEMNLTSQHDGTTTQTSIALPLTDVLRKEIPGIKYVAETDNIGKMNHGLLVGDKKLYLGGGAVGVDFFKIFQYPFIKGNANSALKDIYSIVITESTAKALFGDADPMGKSIRFDDSQNMTVTGVIRDIPANATLQFNYLVPFAYSEATQGWIRDGRVKWTYNSFSG